MIEEVHGIAAATQKLIAYGKVMEDEAKTITDYKIAENGFIVVMTVKVSITFESCQRLSEAKYILYFFLPVFCRNGVQPKNSAHF
jgi:hypothetical protein